MTDMIIRAKTKELFTGKPLTKRQRQNSELNMQEIETGKVVLESFPRRIVLELTNACNLNCIMCGRNAVEFKQTQLDMKWFYSLESLFDIVEEVTLMGWGEPTVHPCFKEMLRVLSKHSARKYFCTNGMRLDELYSTIFDCEVDVIAVSVDGATQNTNAAIRKGSDLKKINNCLKEIVAEKRTRGLKYPHINYVFCAMKRNLQELPDLVKMASEIGLEEVKVVFFTSFNDDLADETLYGAKTEVKDIFNSAAELAGQLGILLKLPYIQGDDPAGTAYHRDCFVAYRDFYLGSDGYVRPCMSTADKLFKYDSQCSFDNIWNCTQYQTYRESVNTPDMPRSCTSCYQSSHCNWNNKKSYIQTGEVFAPSWEQSS